MAYIFFSTCHAMLLLFIVISNCGVTVLLRQAGVVTGLTMQNMWYDLLTALVMNFLSVYALYSNYGKMTGQRTGCVFGMHALETL